MKNLITICFLFSVSNIGYCQSNNINIYNDALSLTEDRNVDDILRKYDIDSLNVFLSDFLISRKIKVYGSTDSTKRKASTLVKTLGNTEVTAIADGLAQFLVTRVKKELSIAFFQDFKKTIQNPNFRDFQILFHNSYEHLNLIDDKIYEFKPYLSSIRTNAITDFKVLPYQLSAVLADPESQLHLFTDTIPNLRYSLGLSFNLINELNDKKNFGLAIEKLNTKIEDYYSETDIKKSKNFIAITKDIKSESIKKGVELFRLISFALKDNSAGDSSYYLPSDKITKLTNDPKLLQNFLGLMVAATKLGGLNLQFDSSLYKELNNDTVKVNLLKSTQFLKGFKDAATLFKQSKEKVDAEKVNLYFNGISKLIVGGKNLNSLLSNEKADSIFIWLEKSNTLVKNLYNKNYTTSMLQILDFYKAFGNSSGAKFNQKLYKHGTFLAQISQLENTKEVEQLIEVYAAPVGSYRDKGAHNFSIAFDSYVGAGWGQQKDSSATFIISTPIGISMSFGFPNNNWFPSLTIMPSFFDIGPLVSYRFKSSEPEIAKIFLKDIIAPGIFGSIGIHKNIPIFLNIGWQKPASLNGAGAEVNTYRLKAYSYFTANLAVNIPLLSLFIR